MLKSREFIAFLLVLSALFHGLGISLPMISVQGLRIFDYSIFGSKGISIVDLSLGLLKDGEYLLFLIVSIFSIVFPVVKIGLIQVSLIKSHNHTQKFSQYAQYLGKWSMVDVFVVAIVIYAAKSAGITKITSESGLWFFTASIIISIIASYTASKN